MSGILNKVKEVVSGHSASSTDHAGNTAGPHNTDTANRADPRVDSDNSHGYGHNTTGTTGLGSSTGTGYGSSNTGTTGLGSTTGTGYNSSSTGTGYGSTTAGPHDSNVANKLDPRVDSDRDGSRTAGNYGSGTGVGSTGYSSTTGTHGTGTGTGIGSTGYSSSTGTHGSTTAGPHNSNIANKLDPRVDSDRDGSNTVGGTRHVDPQGLGQTFGHSGTTGTYDEYTSTGTHGTGTYGSNTTTSGPHNSNIVNKLDPRVDSDRDGSRTAGNTGYGSSTTTGGTGYGSSTTGHSTGTGYGSSTGTGYGSTTAGPHDSNIENKLDPRVDSDRDGSRTAGNTGYGSSTTGTGYGSSTTGTNYDSNTTGTGYGSSTTGHSSTTGNTGSVAPHSSSLLNKLDPRVDSNTTGNPNTAKDRY